MCACFFSFSDPVCWFPDADLSGHRLIRTALLTLARCAANVSMASSWNWKSLIRWVESYNALCNRLWHSLDRKEQMEQQRNISNDQSQRKKICEIHYCAVHCESTCRYVINFRLGRWLGYLRNTSHCLNSLWPSDAIRWFRYRMACIMNQCSNIDFSSVGSCIIHLRAI